MGCVLFFVADHNTSAIRGSGGEGCGYTHQNVLSLVRWLNWVAMLYFHLWPCYSAAPLWPPCIWHSFYIYVLHAILYIDLEWPLTEKNDIKNMFYYIANVTVCAWDRIRSQLRLIKSNNDLHPLQFGFSHYHSTVSYCSIKPEKENLVGTVLLDF